MVKENIWKYLNSYGIETEEELDKKLEDMKLDIGVFVSPIEHGDN